MLSRDYSQPILQPWSARRVSSAVRQITGVPAAPPPIGREPRGRLADAERGLARADRCPATIHRLGRHPRPFGKKWTVAGGPSSPNGLAKMPDDRPPSAAPARDIADRRSKASQPSSRRRRPGRSCDTIDRCTRRRFGATCLRWGSLGENFDAAGHLQHVPEKRVGLDRGCIRLANEARADADAHRRRSRSARRPSARDHPRPRCHAIANPVEHRRRPGRAPLGQRITASPRRRLGSCGSAH